MLLIPFIAATGRDAKNIMKDTPVKVCGNLFLPVVFNIAKNEAAFIANHNTNSVIDQNKGTDVLTADRYGTNPVPLKSAAVRYSCILSTLPYEFSYKEEGYYSY